MKTYKERLPLIDAAIEVLKGEWPNNPDGINTQDVLMAYRGKYVSGLLGFTDAICTRTEFEQRKAELQNKPSFDDHPDAKCFVQDDYGWWLKNTITSDVKVSDLGGWMWSDPDRICGNHGWVNLQQGKIIGSWQDTLEKRPVVTEKCGTINNLRFDGYSIKDADTGLWTIAVPNENEKEKEKDMCECNLSECPRPISIASSVDNDPVNHPPHYTQHPSGVECIQITEHCNFCIGNAIKYLWRAGLKGAAVEDLKKARWYIEREIQRLEGEK